MQVNRGPVDCGFIANQVFVPHLKLQHRGSASSAFFVAGSRKQNEQFDGACGCGNHAEPDLFFGPKVWNKSHTPSKVKWVIITIDRVPVPTTFHNISKLFVNRGSLSLHVLVQWFPKPTVLNQVWNFGQAQFFILSHGFFLKVFFDCLENMCSTCRKNEFHRTRNSRNVLFSISFAISLILHVSTLEQNESFFLNLCFSHGFFEKTRKMWNSGSLWKPHDFRR